MGESHTKELGYRYIADATSAATLMDGTKKRESPSSIKGKSKKRRKLRKHFVDEVQQRPSKGRAAFAPLIDQRASALSNEVRAISTPGGARKSNSRRRREPLVNMKGVLDLAVEDGR